MTGTPTAREQFTLLEAAASLRRAVKTVRNTLAREKLPRGVARIHDARGVDRAVTVISRDTVERLRQIMWGDDRQDFRGTEGPAKEPIVPRASVFGDRTCVYRAFDASGRLLYVGISGDWAKRWVAHGMERPTMFLEAVRLELTWYETRPEALAIEAELIRTLRPPYNAAPKERALRPPFGYARFFDIGPLPPAPTDLSREHTLLLVDACGALAVDIKSLRNLLSEFQDEFEPVYRRVPRKGYRLRVLSEADLHQLRVILARFAAAE